MKLTIFLIATALSFFGLFATAAAIYGMFDSPISNGDMLMRFLFFKSTAVQVFAWGCYFHMGWIWVNNKSIPKALVIIGGFVGCVALFQHIYGLVFVLPAVCMAAYISIISFVNKPKNI